MTAGEKKRALRAKPSPTRTKDHRHDHLRSRTALGAPAPAQNLVLQNAIQSTPGFCPDGIDPRVFLKPQSCHPGRRAAPTRDLLFRQRDLAEASAHADG